jgi:outer membrane receptor protein involved in Fe transport
MADYSAELGDGLKAGMNWLTSYTSGSYADFGRFQPVRGTTAGSLVPSTSVNRQYLPIAGYWLSSLSLRLEGEGWSARIFADNLFDARFKTSRSFVFANSNFATSDVNYYANRPRTIGIGLNKRF